MAIPSSLKWSERPWPINFDDESVFPPEEAEIYRRMKREGGTNRALSILEQAMAKAKEEGAQASGRLLLRQS